MFNIDALILAPRVQSPYSYDLRMFDKKDKKEYIKWTQLFTYTELKNIAEYGFTFIKDEYFTNDALGFIKNDGHIVISFNRKDGYVSFIIGAEELSYIDIEVIYKIQKTIINKQIKKHKMDK